MTQADSQVTRIDKFFSMPAARADFWRDLVAAAQRWASGKGERKAVEAALSELAVMEEFHAYPGVRLINALREKLGTDAAQSFATLARNISSAIITRDYKHDPAEWEVSEDVANAPADRLPPTLGT